MQSAKEKEEKKMNEEILQLLSKPTAKVKHVHLQLLGPYLVGVVGWGRCIIAPNKLASEFKFPFWLSGTDHCALFLITPNSPPPSPFQLH